MSQVIEVGSGTVTADLYVEIQLFYARQMRLLDDLELERYAETFTEDGVVEHVARGERAEGREAMLAAMRAARSRYEGVVVRHWFDKLLLERQDFDTVQVSYFALVSRTSPDGTVTFEPTFSVTDVLVRRGGRLYAASRRIARDTPSPSEP